MKSCVTFFGQNVLHNEFNEDCTELQFLQSKPSCFIVVGKPGCGKSTLAKNLSEVWKCQWLQSTNVIKQEIEEKSKVGTEMHTLLMNGEMITTEFVIQLLKEKLSCREVRHYGYVLDDFPSLSCESISVEEQLQLIKENIMKPDFIINIKIPDIDLSKRKCGIKTDSITGELYLKSIWNSAAQSKIETNKNLQQEPEEEEDMEEIPNESLQISKVIFETLVQPPEYQLQAVNECNQLFKDCMLKLLEDYISDHDRQYVVELDGNCSSETVFEQLMLKLDTYTASRAIAPVILLNSEEDEISEDMDDDEILRRLSSYHITGPLYRWRRSKWGRFCPVALKDGNMIQGKPQYATSFMDKLYVLSSDDALSLFLKNPRPFLIPPMPAIPCKIAVLGPSLSGKTSLCKFLAKHYKASVFDVNSLVFSALNEERQKVIEQVRIDSTEHAISFLQNKTDQEFYLELANKNPVKVFEENLSNDSEIINEQLKSPPIVTESNEEVCRMVEEAVSAAQKQEIKLSPEIYVDALKDAIDEMIKARKSAKPDAPMNGGWILDGFPESNEQLKVMINAGIVPDNYIILVDRSDSFELVQKRYYEVNKEEITNQYRSRLIAGKKAVLQDVELEIKRLIEVFEAEKQNELEEEVIQQDSITSVKNDSEDETMVQHESKENVEVKEDESIEDVEGSLEKSDIIVFEKKKTLYDSAQYLDQIEKQNSLLAEIQKIEEDPLGCPPLRSPEFITFYDGCQIFEKELSNLQNLIPLSGGKIVFSDIQDDQIDNIGKQIADKLDGIFGYHANEVGALDMDEEEEDMTAVLEEEHGQGEDDENGEDARQKLRHFGYTKNFDPVAFHENFCLWPGNSEIAAKYREKLYYFFSSENQEKFISNPLKYLPKNNPFTPPPPRILFLGSKGSGKTEQGRILANELEIFHISFQERLQEILLLKLKHKVGPEYEDQHLLQKELSVSVEEAVQKATGSSADVTEDEAEEEESEFSKAGLNDEEQAIYNYLIDDEALPEKILLKVVSPFWNEEPYKSTGFILEGFPKTSEECHFLLEKGFYPDIALLLHVEENDVINRIFPFRFNTWKERKNLQLLKQERIQEKKKEIRNAKIQARRAELINEQNAQRLDGIEEEEDDIEDILQAEFEEDTDEFDMDDEETEEEVINRIKSEIADIYESDSLKIQSVQELLEEGLVPCNRINGRQKISLVRKHIRKSLQSYVDCRQSLFEQVYPLSIEFSERLLATGYKYPSAFAKWDPVKLYEGDLMCPIRGENNPLYPVGYHHYIYFLSSLDSKEKFCADPIKYAFTTSLVKPVVPIQIAVVGPPKSGKTTLCKHFQKDYGTVHVSVGKSIRKLLETQSHTYLVQQIQSHLYRGNVVPDELAVESLAVVLLDTVCTTRGFTIDGYPCTSQQMSLMSKRGILPVKIIELQINAREMLHRNELDAFSRNMWQLPLHDSNDILVVKYSCYCEHTAPLQIYYKAQHQNWEVVDAKISKWKLWNISFKIVMSSIKHVQKYITAIAKGEAASIFGLCVSPQEFKKHLGVYGHYCPVSLNVFEELIDCSDKSYLKNAVEYQAKYYKLASEEKAKIFLSSPKEFVPPFAKVALPSEHLLPKQHSQDEVKSLFPMQLQFGGYCPVEYVEKKFRYEALTLGMPHFVVEYRKMLYQFCNKKNLFAFMKTPEKYYSVKLPNKVPPKQAPINCAQLPMLGYLEQNVSHSLIRALTEVGHFKPKFPYASVQKSCFFFISFHLKAFNPRYSSYTRQKYLKKLSDFKEMCELIPYLGNNMTKQYRNYRPVEFDSKMDVFVNLKKHKPTRIWAK